ncbi:MAG: alpha/beta fold hydrolase [Pseudomonadota bacterium]
MSREQSLNRGTHEFEVNGLRTLLGQLQADQQLSQEDLSEYRRFYGFDQLIGLAAQSVQVLMVGSQRLVVQTFEPSDSHAGPKGYVLMCHGYYDHVGLYGHVLKYLLDRNLVVVTFDQIGHGLSSGLPATIEHFDRYIEATLGVFQFAQRRFPQSDETGWHWVGQSMGGAIVLETLHHNPEIQANEVVLFAPLVRPYAWWFARWVYAIAKRTVESRPRRISSNSSSAEFIRLQHVDPLQADILPVQWVSAMVEWMQRFIKYERAPGSVPVAPKIIQGQLDKTIDWHFGTRFLRKQYADSQWCILPEASHHLVNESDELLAQIWIWLDERCAW